MVLSPETKSGSIKRGWRAVDLFKFLSAEGIQGRNECLNATRDLCQLKEEVQSNRVE